MTRSVTAFGEAFWWGIERTTPDGDVQTIIGGYNGVPFNAAQDAREAALEWARYDARYRYMGPGIPIWQRPAVDAPV
jgi:hypothetical protein